MNTRFGDLHELLRHMDKIVETRAVREGKFLEYTRNLYGEREFPSDFPALDALPTGVKTIMATKRHPRCSGQYCPSGRVLALYTPEPRIWIHELAHAIDAYLHPDGFPDFPRCEIVACRVQLWGFDHFKLPEPRTDTIDNLTVSQVKAYAAYWGRTASSLGLSSAMDADTPDKIVEKRVERIQKYILERS